MDKYSMKIDDLFYALNTKTHFSIWKKSLPKIKITFFIVWKPTSDRSAEYLEHYTRARDNSHTIDETD